MQNLFTILFTVISYVSIIGQDYINQIEMIKLKMSKERVIKIMGPPSFINTYNPLYGYWTQGTKEIWLYGAENQKGYAKCGSVYFDSLGLVQYVFDNKLGNDNIMGHTDTSEYILSINQGIIGRRGNQTYLIVPTILTNNTNDTLKYLTMSCSWQEFYFVDNDMLHVAYRSCLYDSPIALVLAPHKSVETKVKLWIGQLLDGTKIRFKLGFNLIKVKSKDYKSLKKESWELRETKNILWSNSVEI